MTTHSSHVETWQQSCLGHFTSRLKLNWPAPIVSHVGRLTPFLHGMRITPEKHVFNYRATTKIPQHISSPFILLRLSTDSTSTKQHYTKFHVNCLSDHFSPHYLLYFLLMYLISQFHCILYFITLLYTLLQRRKTQIRKIAHFSQFQANFLVFPKLSCESNSTCGETKHLSKGPQTVGILVKIRQLLGVQKSTGNINKNPELCSSLICCMCSPSLIVTWSVAEQHGALRRQRLSASFHRPNTWFHSSP